MVDVGTTTEDLERFLAAYHLAGAGLRRRGGVEPRTGKTAAHWSWEGIYNGLMQSGKIVSIGADGMTGMRSVTGVEARNFPIWMNVQIVMPGERTQAHRNMRSETRLVLLAPPGAVFVCEGEAYPMERGDVVISPAWTYHDHFNDGNEPAIFVDGYDNGYNPNVNINERFPNDAPYQEITRAEGYTLKTRGHLRQLAEGSVSEPGPLPPMRYRWTDTQTAINAIRESEIEGDPYDGLHFVLANPVDGGPTLPTIAWHVQLLNGRQKTLAHRHNSTTFYHVFEGEGVTTIDGERLEWHQGDIFAVPPWTWHNHENLSRSDTMLVAGGGWPGMKKLGFYREEKATP
jgi:gentisate 1,2-dioxygenase